MQNSPRITVIPKDMSVDEIQSFPSHLASEKNVATSTQNQAINAQP